MIVTDGKATPESAQRNERKQIKAVIDVLAAVSCFGFFVVSFVLAHYYPNLDQSGHIPLPMKLVIANMPFALLGTGWLLFRNFKALCDLAVKHPAFFSPRYKLLRVLAIPLAYLIGYLIIRNTLFRWIP